MPVRKPQILPSIQLQYLSGGLSLPRAALYRSAGAHFATGDVQRSSEVAQLLHLEHRAADGELKIVGMSEYGENIYCHEKLVHCQRFKVQTGAFTV